MSRGQLARNRWNFPAMNDRGGRRRLRKAIERAHQFALELVTTGNTFMSLPYSRGGLIDTGEPIRVTLALDECVVNKRDGQWQCVRTDPEHLATERHRIFPAALQLNESTVLADLNAAAHQFRHAPREPERPTE